jgi:hypothetical protein
VQINFLAYRASPEVLSFSSGKSSLTSTTIRARNNPCCAGGSEFIKETITVNMSKVGHATSKKLLEAREFAPVTKFCCCLLEGSGDEEGHGEEQVSCLEEFVLRWFPVRAQFESRRVAGSGQGRTHAAHKAPARVQEQKEERLIACGPWKICRKKTYHKWTTHLQREFYYYSNVL